MWYQPVVGPPLYHPWFLACDAHVKHVEVHFNLCFSGRLWTSHCCLEMPRNESYWPIICQNIRTLLTWRARVNITFKRGKCVLPFALSVDFGSPDPLMVVLRGWKKIQSDFVQDRHFTQCLFYWWGSDSRAYKGTGTYVGGKWRGHEKCRKRHTCWEGGGASVLWGLSGSFVAAWTGNISERLKSVDILERFKAVIFQSGGSLCDAGWPAARSRRYCTHSFSSPWIRKDPHHYLVYSYSLLPDLWKT